MLGLNKKELRILKSLDTPKKIQDFLNKIPINFEKDGETCFSPRGVLKNNKAHCMEGALFAAAALRVNGEKPLVVDLLANDSDDDHVLCDGRRQSALLRHDPHLDELQLLRLRIYKNIRE